MLIIKKVSFFAIAIIGILVSMGLSNKRGSITDYPIKQTFIEISPTTLVGCDIPLSDLRKVGKIHNTAVIKHYFAFTKKYNVNRCGTCIKEFKDYLNSIDLGVKYKPLKTNKKAYIESIMSTIQVIKSTGSDFSKWKNHKFSAKSYNYLLRMNSLILKASNYEDLDKTLLILQNNAIRNLDNCNDFSLVVGTIEVARHSAKLWAPKKVYLRGGEEEEGPTDPDEEEEEEEGGGIWNDIIVGDAIGSANYWLTVGVTGAALGVIPGTNGVILAGWGLSAALGSAWGGAVHLRKPPRLP